MSPFIDPPADTARIALAIDALCTGRPHPVLAHVAREDDPPDGPGAYGLYCTPLEPLETIHQAVALLERVRPPGVWEVVGLCAPTSIRRPDGAAGRHAAWFVHVVGRHGGRASRLAVPADPRLCGPVSTGENRIDHGLRRLLGPSRSSQGHPRVAE